MRLPCIKKSLGNSFRVIYNSSILGVWTKMLIFCRFLVKDCLPVILYLYGIGDVENKNKKRISMVLGCGFCENILPKKAFAFDDDLYL
ncbi:hypothetical protein HMPREF9304_13610 [Hoylesella timonensis S9-PR14]|uniref:Uncharacterized protein n=1 Tax=Hoylesella timonensis S9-PR14 TaxID=1401062 RepID=A0A098YQH5_9BACT|nr:hypothetical protein HMPREF9304_13610 [Hoylesella timonensis S9-PR14]